MGCLKELSQRLGVLILLLGIFLIIVLVVTGVFKPSPAAATPTPAATLAARAPNLIDIPEKFENHPEYAAAPGTEVKGLGVVDQGFTFLGTGRAELITGYLLQIPTVELAGFKLELLKPNAVLDLLVLGFKAIGVNDRQDLPDLAQIGDESKGVTFWTTWNGSKLRVDAVVFRKGSTGAVAAVVYPEGQKSSVTLEQIARAVEAKIVPGK